MDEIRKRGRPKKPDTAENWAAHQAARDTVEGARAMVSQARLDEMAAAVGPVYTLEETAAYLGVTSRTVLTYLQDGRMRGVKVGGAWKVSAGNLKRFMEGE